MKLRISRDARQDLQAIYDYQVAESANSATAVMSDVQAAIRYIERQPRGSQKTDLPHVYAKVVSGRPYKIFYRLSPADVEIIHVRHTALPVWKGQ